MPDFAALPAAPSESADMALRRLLVLGVTAPPADLFGEVLRGLPEAAGDRPVHATLAYSGARGPAPFAAPPETTVEAVALPVFRSRSAAQDWIAGRRADAVLWLGPPGPDHVMEALAVLDVPVLGAGMGAPPAMSGRARRQRRQVLAGFSTLLAEDAKTAERLAKLVPAGVRIRAAGPLVPPPKPPECYGAEQEDFTSLLAARPVWLALCPAQGEIDLVLAAHRVALSGAHRLLLLLVPSRDGEGPDLARRLAAEGWRIARRGADEEPDETTEIYIADSLDELGLWVRVAPLSYLGGSFTPGAPVADPGPSAGLGSAIIAGPSRDGGSRLLGLLAAREGLYAVSHPDELGAAVSDLLIPDRAAIRAHAAWSLIAETARGEEMLVAELGAALRGEPE